MSQTEADIRRAGALVAAVSASALMRLPAAGHVSLALHVLFLLGCAAVQLAQAHRSVADLARRAAEAARALGVALGASAAGLRRAGLAGVLLYALYDAADVRTDVAAEGEASSLDKVKAFILFLVFLAAVWAVYLSMVTGRGAPAPRPSAAAEDDDGVSAAGLRRAGLAGIIVYALYDAADVSTDKVKAFILFLVFLAAVWAVYLSMVTGRGSPAPRPSAAAVEDDGGELNTPASTCPC